MDTSKVERFAYTFYNCRAMTKINYLDVSSAITTQDMFVSCGKLNYIKLNSTNASTVEMVVSAMPGREGAAENTNIIDLSSNSADVIEQLQTLSKNGWTVKKQ